MILCAIDTETHVWMVWLDQAGLDAYRDAGMEVGEVINTIPRWWVDQGYPVRDWCDMQDRGDLPLFASQEERT